MPHPFFHPSPERTLLLIDELVDPDLSLRAIAERHQTSVAALSLWLALPETIEELATFRSVFSDRIRLLATANLSSAISSLSRILDRFNQSDRALDPSLTPDQRQRARETACRAASLLVRLTSHRPRPAARTRAESFEQVSSSQNHAAPVPPIPAALSLNFDESDEPDSPSVAHARADQLPDSPEPIAHEHQGPAADSPEAPRAGAAPAETLSPFARDFRPASDVLAPVFAGASSVHEHEHWP